MQQENLVLIVGAPRSGSTLLQRLVASHSQVHAHPEPHVLTPLAFLGYHQTVDKAPFDHVNAAQAFREFAEELPRGEEDYLDALRAYALTLYERALSPSGKRNFVDKTPAYALILPFVTKLLPRAKYIVLTRHPLAIMHSVAHSFFAGDYEAAERANPIVSKYVPAIASLLIDKPVPFVHVRYEDVVAAPESALQRICEHLGLAFEPGMVEYGKHQHVSKSFGDPVGVAKHQRPVADSLETWAQDLLARKEAHAIAERVIANLAPAHLESWGYPPATLFAPLGQHHAQRTRRSVIDTYRFKRRLLLMMRRRVQNKFLGGAVKRIRYVCDLLLRT
jgi:hypothetical protein